MLNLDDQKFIYDQLAVGRENKLDQPVCDLTPECLTSVVAAWEALKTKKRYEKWKYPLQQRLYTPDGPPGTCFVTCISCITQIPLCDLPDPIDDWYKDKENWWELHLARLKTLLYDNRYSLVETDVATDLSPTRCIAMGPSNTCPHWHAVVGALVPKPNIDGRRSFEHDFKIIHDPHPDKPGVKSVERYGFICLR